MTQIEDQAAQSAAGGEPEDLTIRVAWELLERAKAEGVSLVGPGGLLAGVTKTVLQAALDAEMADHLGYDRGERPPFRKLGIPTVTDRVVQAALKLVLEAAACISGAW